MRYSRAVESDWPGERETNDSAVTLVSDSAATAGAGTVVPHASRTSVLPRRDTTTPAHSDDQPRFRRIELLGTGGIGEVVLAMDEDIQRKVAIKRLRDDAVTDAMLLRFADEVRTIGQLEHPGIVPVHDVGVDTSGKHYLVMKYIEGETLEQVIERLRAGDARTLERFGYAERLEVIAKVLEALDYAHKAGFIHRDLKPANIIVGQHGEVTLMDWGIAKPIGSADEIDDLNVTSTKPLRLVETQAGAVLGTPYFMAPEQAAGMNTELDARTDVFALGLLTTELFTLHHPFEDLQSTTAVIASLLHKELDSKVLHPMFAHARAPMSVMWFVERALQGDRTKRYADAGEMLQALRKVRDGSFAPHCPATATKAVLARADRWIDCHPLAFAVGFVLGVLGIVGALATAIWLLLR